MAESILGKINYLTEEQYQNAKANGQINEDEIYLTPDDKPYIETIIDEVTTNTVEVTTATTVKVGTYTIPSDGLYLITGNVPLNHYGQTGRSLHVQLKLNGTEFFSTASVLNTAAWTVSEGVAYAQEFKKGDIITIHLGSSAATNWSCGTAKFQFTKIMKTIRSINQTGEYYFSSEQVIGTCLGKPLYMKWVNGTTAAAGADHLLLEGIDKLIDYHIMIHRSNVDQYHTITHGMLLSETGHSSPLYIDNHLHRLHLYLLNTYYANQNFYGWIKYTKTTD
jgi:hypothetical protein